MDMTSDAVKTIINAALPASIEAAGAEWIKKGEYELATNEPEAVLIHTLSGVVDFCKYRIDDWVAEEIFIHVLSNATVALYSKHEPFSLQKRGNLVRSEAIASTFQWKQKLTVEQFIIDLNSQFAPTEDRDYLLKLVSCLTKEASQQLSDNGVSQTARIKKSITMNEEIKIKNPVRLRPFRTFAEVEQPESEFIFRVHDEGETRCALYPCDGNKWVLEAIQNIRAFFVLNLPDVAVIA